MLSAEQQKELLECRKLRLSRYLIQLSSTWQARCPSVFAIDARLLGSKHINSMGADCSCCDDDTTVEQPPFAPSRPAVQPVAPVIRPPSVIQSPIFNGSPVVGPDADCCCSSSSPCPLPRQENHACRCVEGKGNEECLSRYHCCLCKRDAITVCRRHMVRVLGERLCITNICSICISSLAEEPQSVVRLKVCGHYYHCSCLKEWLQRGRHRCPLCSRRIASRASSDLTQTWLEASHG